MVEETKIVKGGFRATLALILSIIALALSIVSFNRTGGETALRAEIKNLQTKIKELSQETKDTYDRISKAIKKEESKTP